MPLMRCPDCHKEISESAISCPNCGLPRPQYELMSRERKAQEAAEEEERQAGIRRLFITGGVAVVSSLALAGWGLFGPSTQSLGRRAMLVLLAAGVGFAAWKVLTYAWRERREGR